MFYFKHISHTVWHTYYPICLQYMQRNLYVADTLGTPQSSPDFLWLPQYVCHSKLWLLCIKCWDHNPMSCLYRCPCRFQVSSIAGFSITTIASPDPVKIVIWKLRRLFVILIFHIQGWPTAVRVYANISCWWIEEMLLFGAKGIFFLVYVHIYVHMCLYLCTLHAYVIYTCV